MKLYRKIVVILLLMSSFPMFGRDVKFGLQTNLLQWGNLGTVNLEANLGFSRRYSFYLESRYNPWKFRNEALDFDMFNNQKTLDVGFRWWPWYVFSGWWVSTGVQYSDYMTSGIFRHALNTGQAVGCKIGTGYSLMLTKHLNIEFGGSFWFGRILDYKLYCCPDCMEIREQGNPNFIGLNDLDISLVIVF